MAVILKKLFILLLIFSFVFSQKVYTFTEDEVKSLFSSIKELERQDSLNNLLIINYKQQLDDTEKLNTNNELIIQQLENQLQLKDDLIKVIKPKWYENKYLWFGYGVCTILIPTFVFGR